MRWLQIGLILSLIGLGFGVFSAEYRPLLCCGGFAPVFAFLIWIIRKRFHQFREGFDPKQLYLTPTGYITGAQGFVMSAQEFVDLRIPNAYHIPFESRWPIYDQMNLEQMDWYFYWRDQVRNGNYPETSLTYIYLFVYELINEVGVQNLQIGYDLLHAVWQNYRTAHPKLDETLADWIVDYATLNNLAPSAESIYSQLTDGKGETLDWIVQTRIADGWASMPIPILDRLTDHRIAKSSFVQAGHAELVAIGMRLALTAVDKDLRQREGMGIWAKYRPNASTLSTRKPFNNAIYAGETREIMIGELYMASKHEPLRDFLTGVVKYAENKLREQVKFRGRLQVKGLDMSLQNLIDKVMDTDFNMPEGVKEELLAALQKIADKPVSAEVNLQPQRKKQSAARSIPPRNTAFAINGRTLSELYNAGVFRRHSFLTIAEKMANWSEGKTEFVPFQTSYSTYGDLKLAQLEFYFYWRDEVRNERYPKTESSYIFLHIYELLSNIGVSSPRDGYHQLMGLWTNYDDAHPIGRYLVKWLPDYLALNSCDIDPLSVYDNSLAHTHLLDADELDIALDRALTQPDGAITLNLLDRFVDHALVNGVFARAGYREWLVVQIPNAIHHLEAQSGFFQQFRSSKPFAVWRTPFNGMVTEVHRDRITIAETYRYRPHDQLRGKLTEIVKYIDQQLREKADFRPNVAGVKLKGEAKGILDVYLERVNFSAESLSVPTLTQDQTAQPQKEALHVMEESAEQTRGYPSPVPLNQSYTLSFNQLYDRQRGWYIYWRTRARKGDYLPTPSAYIILFAHELLNNIGVSDGGARLLALWQQYRTTPIGDKLASWLLGYTFVHNRDPRQLLLRPELRPYTIATAPDLILATETIDFATMPIDLLTQFSDHDLASSSFYTGDNIPLLQRTLPLAVAEVDQHVKRYTGKGLLERFTPPKGVAVSVANCWSAFYPNWPTQIALPDVPAYSQQRSFCDLITGIIKYTENYLRESQNVRGRLRSFTISEDVQQVLDRWLPTIGREQRPAPKVEIDTSRIAQLREESEAVFEMLNIEDDGSAVAPPAAEIEEVDQTPIIEESADEAFALPEDEWQALFQTLSPPHHDLLRAILHDDDPLTQLRTIATANGTMPALLIDTINEHAQEIIGDLLLELDPAPRFIDDEYRDNIALLF